MTDKSLMTDTEIIEKLGQLQSITEQYDDVIGWDATDLAKECRIITAQQMQTQFTAFAEKDRLLNIGIIGRVKAGKSSLLNSIFFNGDPVLPKAATPMTASLTVISRGDTFSATVEYFTPDDVEVIKQEHDEHKQEWERVLAEEKKKVEERARSRGEIPDKSKAERATKRVMEDRATYASFDQYKRMEKTGISVPEPGTQTIKATSIADLHGKLNEYVGSNGRMMPWTKSVEIHLPDFPQNIRVVDTPGINDPVKSREARTEDYLKQCDVVFVISPAGQFITSEDTDLMDRLSSKEGVSELYFVATQADNQLSGSPGEEADWDLHKAIENIRGALSECATDALAMLKQNNPEVAGQFDQLLEDGNERIMVTSAMCHAMYLKFDKRSAWDEEMKHAWNRLSKNYPDYFSSATSAKLNLEKLSNIATVNEKINLVRQMKDKIIATKQTDYVNAQKKNIEEFIEALIEAINKRIVEVANTDIKTVQEQKKKTEHLYSQGSEAVDGTFEDCLDDFKHDLRKTITKETGALFSGAKKDTKSAEGTKIESEEISTSKWYKPWSWGSSETEHNEVTTVRAGTVKSRLNDLITDLQETLVSVVEEKKNEWKKSVQSKVTHALIEAVQDVDLIDFASLKQALRRSVNNMELPELDLGSHAFNSSHSGKLKGDKAEQFIAEVEAYMSNLRSVFSKESTGFITRIEKSAKREKMSDMLFANLRTQLETLEKDINNKTLTLDRLNKCLTALKGVA